MKTPKLFVALDTPDSLAAKQMAAHFHGLPVGIKIGLTLLAHSGPKIIDDFTESDWPVFVDAKLHDIPHQVAGAVEALAERGPQFITVHASGGETMLKAAREAAYTGASNQGLPEPKLLAVTVLTSLNTEDLNATGQRGPVSEQVTRLARLAFSCGINGVVCSPNELSLVPRDAFKATPGIRPEGSDHADQRRVMSPKEALSAGADLLIVGRPITQAKDPRAAAEAILTSMGEI
jgi:orotidine-5'-phosphate decarboxylase